MNSLIRKVAKLHKLYKYRSTPCEGPFTPAIFAAILSAISNRPCKLLAIQIAAESPVVKRAV